MDRVSTISTLERNREETWVPCEVAGVHVDFRSTASKEGDCDHCDHAVPAEDDCFMADVDPSLKLGELESRIFEVFCELLGPSLEVGDGARFPEHIAGHCDDAPLLAVVCRFHAHQAHDKSSSCCLMCR